MSYNFLLLDAARAAENIERAKELNSKHLSLYMGTANEDLVEVSPYIFAYENGCKFSDWYAENGWGDAWGLILKSTLSFEQTHKHFRKSLLVKAENGQELYFRFYDPRVLKIFLPTCDEKQILEFFGPVESFIVEGDTRAEAIRFWQVNGILKMEVLPAEKVFGAAIITSVSG